MNLINFKTNIKTLLNEAGYNLYFGNMPQYNSNREVLDKTVIIEPFIDIPIATKDCSISTQLSFIILKKVDFDYNGLDTEGTNIVLEQELRDMALELYNLMLNSTFITPLQTKYNVKGTFYNVENSTSTNNQVTFRFRLNCEIYDI